MGKKYIQKRYLLERVIGEGGMGTVYLATDTQVHRKVAIKNIRPENLENVYSFVRLKREAKFLLQVSHPNIVKIYDFIQEDKLLYLVMEYIDGLSLEEVMRNNHLPFEDKLFISYQIVEAIRCLNSQGIIHRDVKPSNIIISECRKIKLLDLGIAKSLGDSGEVSKLTKTNTILGTPGYMSPEQVNGNVSSNSDVFTAATVIYQLFSGTPDSPFLGKNTLDTMVKVGREQLPHLQSTNPNETLRLQQISNILELALHKEPEYRINIEEFYAKLHNLCSKYLPKGQVGKSKIRKNTHSFSVVEKRKNNKTFLILSTTILSALLTLYFIFQNPLKKFVIPMESFEKYKFAKAWSQNEAFLKEFRNSPHGHILKAIMLYHGYGTSKCIYTSKKIAEEWVPLLQKEQDIYASYFLSQVHLHGIGVKKNLILAFNYAAEATKKVYPLAFTCEGKIYIALKNHPNAIRAFEKAAQLKEAEGMRELADYYFNGAFIKQDIAKALYYFKTSFAKGNARAASSIGYIYHFGVRNKNNVYMVKPDATLAKKWFKMGSKNGDPISKNNLATIFLNELGAKPSSQNKKQIFTMFLQAAKAGSNLAMRSAGNMYCNDFQSPYKGLYWIIKSIQAGNNLAKNDWNSRIANINFIELQKQAMSPNQYARYVLGYWYTTNNKPITGIYYLIKAHLCDKDNLTIIDDVDIILQDQTLLATIMRMNQKINVTKEEAVVLGFLYEMGIVFKNNKSKAKRYYKVSTSLGETSPLITQRITSK